MGLRKHFTAKWDFRSRVPKSGFAVAKYPVEWGFGCEKWEFLRFGDFAAISQLRNEGMRLRNGTCVPRGGFAAAKIFLKGAMRLRNHFAAKGLFRSEGLIS